MSAIRHATGLDVITSTEGDIFIRFYDGTTIFAVAGMKADGALVASEQLSAACEAVILRRPTDAPAVH